ncbi:class I adenylate-forming enzyme family protein (plasmid) [Haloarcula salina]|uniref:class I adenylate-forming enzyme family protein n=1 Tax=Haloarcula salina TaxID=1429914 RepID=UPI003C6ED67A
MSKSESRDRDRRTESTVSNAGALYRDALDSHPYRTAFIDGETGEEVTYREFDERVASAGNALSALGVERGDRVALCFPNELEHLYTLFGAMQIGAVPLPINVELPESKLTYLLGDSDAEVLVASNTADIRALSLALSDAVDGVDTCAIVREDTDVDSPVDAAIVPFATRMDEAAADLVPVDVDGDDPALQPYTSGTTGHPKGVVISHRGVDWNSDAVQKVHYLEREDRGLVAAPLYHKNAMAGAIKPLLQVGGSVVVMREFESADVFGAIEAYEVTYLRGVPAMFKALARDEEAAREHDLSSVEWAVAGSGNLPDSLADTFQSLFGAPIGEGYGLTEAGVVALSPRWGPRKSESAGLSLPGCETRVVDPETDEELPPGQAGELLIANPQLARYHNRPEANEETFVERGGTRFMRTGDYVRKDEHGYHYVLGRLDDMLLVGGNNVYPIDVENVLLEHDAVEDAAVVGVDHEMKGEAPVAFVVAPDATEETIKGFALDNGPNYAHPRRVFCKDRLPLAGTAKVDKAALRAEARERIDLPL